MADPIWTEVIEEVTVITLEAPQASVVCGQFNSLISGVLNEAVESAMGAKAYLMGPVPAPFSAELKPIGSQEVLASRFPGRQQLPFGRDTLAKI